MAAFEFGHNRLGGFGPDKGFGAGIVLGEISIDGGLQVNDRAEHTTADALPRHFGEEGLDGREREAQAFPDRIPYQKDALERSRHAMPTSEQSSASPERRLPR